jgi:hypothetical protein
MADRTYLAGGFESVIRARVAWRRAASGLLRLRRLLTPLAKGPQSRSPRRFS